MMGIVPVQVVGTVKPEDVLFVSPAQPGIAISSSNFCHANLDYLNEATFIGIAFSGRYPENENSVRLFGSWGEYGISTTKIKRRLLYICLLYDYGIFFVYL